MKVWKLSMEDLTNLGGPMGSEYTVHLGSKLFYSREKALEYMEKKLGEKLPEPSGPDYWDCRWIGFSLKHETIEGASDENV